MRTLLGWLLLFGLAASAGWGFSRWRAAAETRAESLTGVSVDEERPGIPARVLLGGPSGAAPIQLEGSAPLDDAPLRPLQAPLPVEPAPSPLPVSPAIVELTVRPGSTLSTLCQEFYTEPDRPPLNDVVAAVARWNDLASPNDLRAGQVLELPPLASLFP